MAEVSVKKISKPTEFRFVRVAVWTVGLDLFGEDTIWMKILLIIMLATSLLSMIQQMTTGILSNELEHSTETLGASIVILCYFIKLLLVWVYEKKFYLIFTNLRQLMSDQATDPSKEPFLLKADKNVRSAGKFFIWVDSFTHSCLLLGVSLNNILNPDNLKVPLRSWFPVDIHSSVPAFIAGFLWVAISLTICTVVVTAMRIASCSINIYILTQIKILQEDFKGFSKIITSSKDVHQYMIKLHKHHKAIIKLMDLNNEVYAYSHLVEVVLSSMQCCLLAYQCSKSGLNDPRIGFFLPFLFGCASSLFVICFMGQLIKDESLKINEAAYNVPWHEMNAKLKKQFIFILRQSSRPLNIQVKQTFIMDLAVFLSSMQSAYSLMAIVNSMETT